ncbi:hypothetical protein NC651_013554 [Populus alba x Populus x berolinensis]|nr:hypothetical protein NC651_013554 [Populus alba x Populus x berolinensis]
MEYKLPATSVNTIHTGRRKPKISASGPGCIVESRVRLSHCSVRCGVRIRSMLAYLAISLDGTPLLGNGGVVLPHKEIKSSNLKPKIVM